jgi:hypothetical protein
MITVRAMYQKIDSCEDDGMYCIYIQYSCDGNVTANVTTVVVMSLQNCRNDDDGT